MNGDADRPVRWKAGSFQSESVKKDRQQDVRRAHPGDNEPEETSHSPEEHFYVAIPITGDFQRPPETVECDGKANHRTYAEDHEEK